MRSTGTELVPAEWYADVPRSVAKHVTFGLVLLIAGFGGFGLWAFQAPLAAAVVAQGSFVATGRNKIVQHLEGGLIKELLVQEGDKVVAGQTLLTLDETSALALERELFLRQIRLEATEARLIAVYNTAEQLVYSDELLAKRADYEVADILSGQTTTFRVAMQGLKNDISLLNRNIEALQIRAKGYDRQFQATERKLLILSEELADKRTLLDQGLVRRADVNALRRAIAESEGQAGRLDAEVAEIDEVIRRYEAQIEQTLSEHRRASLDELQVIQAELDSIREQARTAANVLKRIEIKSPVAGTIVRLYYFTEGGVIESGRPIAEILPSDEPLIIEVQIPRTEIDSVTQGQEATVRLSGLNQRTTPILFGTVYYVSADAFAGSNERGAREVYLARLSISPEELLRVPGFTPTPGMPAQVMIQTAERTFFDYLTKPITDSMNRAFREQ
jgi:membrane fusion protein, type I secretion system